MQPDDATLRGIEEHAVELARGAGRILESHFGRAINIEFKAEDKSNPVSEVDKESEKYLRGAIKARYPDHCILGEEGADEGPVDSDFLWALDPLDGTVNYINGLPIYSVSIGVLYRGAPMVGCIWVPFPGRSEGVVYHARLNQGAYRNGEAISVRKDPTPQPGQLVIMPRVYRRRYRRRAGRGVPVGEVRRTGSIAYEMAMTASGVLQYALFTSP
ncbi:MAG: inositol monophosphatase family protein, partial [Dehalococcoidia bacterium]